ncbi:hypothetical protein F2Q69_00029404 [Brassica cretica]|uniref:Uncharacterized protein n=1 Tax=Brassica cretica TaxID=69181 RepID=A0A8S9S1K4_BRACR|nr:hypothetical protein F2Q69_00029404 [Brassica cretica]
MLRILVPDQSHDLDLLSLLAGVINQPEHVRSTCLMGAFFRGGKAEQLAAGSAETALHMSVHNHTLVQIVEESGWISRILRCCHSESEVYRKWSVISLSSGLVFLSQSHRIKCLQEWIVTET